MKFLGRGTEKPQAKPDSVCILLSRLQLANQNLSGIQSCPEGSPSLPNSRNFSVFTVHFGVFLSFCLSHTDTLFICIAPRVLHHNVFTACAEACACSQDQSTGPHVREGPEY